MSIDKTLEDAAGILGTLARREVPLGEMTTYRVGGRAALFMELADERDLEHLSKAVARTGVDVLVVGKGSNLVVRDGGFAGLAVRLGGKLQEISLDESSVTAGAAAAYPVLARKAAGAGLAGMEWAVGIPGSVGGAVAMNAGGHGAETKDTLLSARLVELSSGKERLLSARELGFTYRHSIVGSSDLVLEASFRLHPDDPASTSERISEIVRWRRENQPGGQNAGSVFTNPPDDSAGRLVEEAGLKGFRLGSARVSEKHANFIQADSAGRADDVVALIEHVRQVVAERTGTRLTVEVRVVGEQSRSR